MGMPVGTTFGTLSARYRNEGAAFFSLLRNLGSSVGIASVQALFIRNTQLMHSRLAEHVTPYADRLPDLNSTAAIANMNGRVTEQATMMAYNNVFKLMFILSLVCVPMAMLFKKARGAQPPGTTVVAE